jgi:hypothetical protein
VTRAGSPRAPTRLLVDTSAWIETLRKDGDAAVRDVVRQATLEGRVATCEMVVLELWNGARGEQERAVIRELEDTLERLSIDDGVWAASRAQARDARAAGVTVPAADILIAACARRHGAALVHCDRHFDQLERLSDSHASDRS